MAGDKLPVMETAREAYRFWRDAWRPALGALVLVGALVAVQQYLALRAVPRWPMLMNLLLLPVQTIAFGALYRLAFRSLPDEPGARPGAGGLQWRALETRLLGAMLLLALLVFLAALLFAFVFTIALMVAAGTAPGDLANAETPEQFWAALSPRGRTVLATLGLLALVLMCWGAIRLTLVLPATAARGRVQVFETWGLTKGNFWRIVGALIVVSAPTVVLTIFESLVIEAMGEEGPRKGVTVLAGMPALLMAVLAGFVASVLQMPLTAGFGAALYRRLSGENGTVA